MADNLLNAIDNGIPQNRSKYFLIAVLDSNKEFKFPKKVENDKLLKSLLEKSVDVYH